MDRDALDRSYGRTEGNPRMTSQPERLDDPATPEERHAEDLSLRADALSWLASHDDKLSLERHHSLLDLLDATVCLIDESDPATIEAAVDAAEALLDHVWTDALAFALVTKHERRPAQFAAFEAGLVARGWPLLAWDQGAARQQRRAVWAPERVEAAEAAAREAIAALPEAS